MSNLLNTTDNRRLHFAEILSNTNEWVALSNLEKQLNVSTRVLQEDIAYFRENFSDFTVHTSKQRVQFIYEQNKGIKNIYQHILNESSAYQFLEAVFLHDGKNLSEFEEMLFLSRSTLYRLIKRINNYLSPFGFQMESNPCRLVGNEKRIRAFFYQYFYEKYSFTHCPFDAIDENALDEFLIFHIKMTQMNNDFAYYSKFKIISVVNLIRFKQDHFVPTENIQMSYQSAIPDLAPHAALFRKFEQAFNITYDDEAIKQIFTSFLDSDFSFNYDHLMTKAAEEDEIKAEVERIIQILHRLSTQYHLPIPNKKMMIYALRNIIHLDYLEPNPGYILYDRDKYFADGLKKTFPDFYQSLYQEMKDFREFLNKPSTEEGIHFYIYTLVTYWKGLISELKKKQQKIQVTIISDRHTTHARMIKDFVAHEFSNQIVVDIYDDFHLNTQILETLNCDLLITTFVIPELTTTRTAYVENVPNYEDVLHLQKQIDEILEEREGGL